MNKINKMLIILGSAKCGTSALAGHLDKHPDIALIDGKEPRYFTTIHHSAWTGPAGEGFQNSCIASEADYLAGFAELTPETWALDASTDYIWRSESIELIKTFAQTAEVKLVCVLRDPLERAISEYNHTLRHGWETLSFGESLDAEGQRRRDLFHPLFYHKRRSTILKDVAAYRAAFGDDLLILDYQDVKNGTAAIEKVSAHIGLSGLSVETIEKRNVSQIPRSKLAKAIKDSTRIRQIARRIVPQKLRARAWTALHAEAGKVKTVTDAEKAKFVQEMRDEILACLAHPLIPTDHWTCTKYL